MAIKRQSWVDYARGIAIILVLYRHVFEGIKNSGISIEKYLAIEHANIMFFSFRMPLFFIISGVFVIDSLKKRGLKNFIETKARLILYPYFLWGVIQITLQLLLSDYVNADRSLVSYLHLFYMPRGLDQFWYLYTLFNVSVLYVIAAHFLKLKHIHHIIIGVLFFYLSVKAYQLKINLGFLGDVLHYYLFFAIGDSVSKLIRSTENKKYLESWKLLLLLFVPFIVAQYYYLTVNIPHAAMNYEFVEFFQPVIFVAIALIGGAFIIFLSFFLQKMQLLSWLNVLGRHSLYIYVAHVMVLASVRIFMTKVLNIYNVPLLLGAGIVFG
ncbi:MAG: acyltransferase, partial [Gloeobacteraceae cyanobacterium ES-bin-316]|nr:acyltransferase [Ferruginibacter sp.]